MSNVGAVATCTYANASQWHAAPLGQPTFATWYNPSQVMNDAAMQQDAHVQTSGVRQCSRGTHPYALSAFSMGQLAVVLLAGRGMAGHGCQNVVVPWRNQEPEQLCSQIVLPSFQRSLQTTSMYLHTLLCATGLLAGMACEALNTSMHEPACAAGLREDSTIWAVRTQHKQFLTMHHKLGYENTAQAS